MTAKSRGWSTGRGSVERSTLNVEREHGRLDGGEVAAEGGQRRLVPPRRRDQQVVERLPLGAVEADAEARRRGADEVGGGEVEARREVEGDVELVAPELLR